MNNLNPDVPLTSAEIRIFSQRLNLLWISMQLILKDSLAFLMLKLFHQLERFLIGSCAILVSVLIMAQITIWGQQCCSRQWEKEMLIVLKSFSIFLNIGIE